MASHNNPSLSDVITHIATLENQLDRAVEELNAMRNDLKHVLAQQHPVATTLNKALKAFGQKINTLREQLNSIKKDIIENCKNAVQSFKDEGILALDAITRFFKLETILSAMNQGVTQAFAEQDKILNTIQTVDTEYRKTSQHLQNIGRALQRREPVAEAKPTGKLVFTAQRVIEINKACLARVQKGIDYSLRAIEQLKTQAKQKPSIRQTIQTINEQNAKTESAVPPTEHKKSMAQSR